MTIRTPQAQLLWLPKCVYEYHFAMRFSIRDLLWLTIVTGLATALWLERHTSFPVRYTGQPLDVAIAGQGFFVLSDPTTAGSLFTRLGCLSTDSNSLLVLNVNGAELSINPAMQIPEDALGVSISPTGRVAVQIKGKSDLVAVGQLVLAKFDKPVRLKQVAPALYTDTTESGLPLLCLPGCEGVGTVIQGALAKHY